MATQSQEKLSSLVSAHHQLSDQLTAAQLRAACAERERDDLAAQVPRVTREAQEVEALRNQQQAQHQQQLDALRAQHTQQLDSLREQHRTQVEAALAQHTRREQYAQREVERYQQQISTMRDKHMQQMEGEQMIREKREEQEKREIQQMRKENASMQADHELEIGMYTRTP